MPPSGFGASSNLPTPYQSLGARGVRTLSSKLLLSLFPTQVTFFKYSIDDFALQKLTGKEDMRGEIEKALSARERATTMEMDQSLFRVVANTALQHLIVAGNFLVHVPPKGRVRGFRLDQYVTKRDPSGNLLEIVVKESISPTQLPAAVAEAAKVQRQAGSTTELRTVDLYTHVTRNQTNWSVYQEAGGVKITKSIGTYAEDALPWIALRMSWQPGEDYGRGYVEEFLGDLDSLEGLSETIVEGSAAAARIVFLVKPNGVTKLRVVAKARNGDVHAGNAEDVTVIQAAHSADLQVAMKQAEAISQRLSYAFILNTAFQRDAERVTAEEIRLMASELDDALGGIHTILSADFQLSAVALYTTRMERNRQVPPLPKGTVTPQITTGIAAIGRGIDQKALRAFTADIIQTLGPEMAFRYLNPTEYIKRAAASYGIDVGGLVKTDDQITQEEQQAKLMEMAQNLGPEALKQVGGMAQAQMKQGTAPNG